MKTISTMSKILIALIASASLLQASEKTVQPIKSPKAEVAVQNTKEKEASYTLITHVNIFDGSNENLKKNYSVLIENNLIKEIGAHITPPNGTNIIDASGKTMTPGFIDAHTHIMMQSNFMESMFQDQYYLGYLAANMAKITLMNGITTIRDAGGNTFSLKEAIEKELVVGPRIYPSGTMISQTGGHADHRLNIHTSSLIGGQPDQLVLNGHMAIADGRAEVLKAVRDNLRKGASQIKIAVGGGTGSIADPLFVTEYTADEIRAAVDAAEDYGTYVLAHVYNSEGIRRAIENGVKCIEHGALVDEETLRLMKEKDIWLSPQVNFFMTIPSYYNEEQKKKQKEVLANIDTMFKLAKKVGFDNIVFGTDMITNPEMYAKPNEELIVRSKWFSNVEILKQATSKSAQLMALSGKKNPYPHPLGLIAVGAYADILIHNGNPIKDINVLKDPETNLALIMKDGIIYKNTLHEK